MQDKGPRLQGTLRAGQSRLPPHLRGVRQMRKKQPPVREQGFPPACAHRRVRLMTFLPSLRPAVRKRSRCRLPALLSCRPHGDARVSFCPLQVWLRGREQQEPPQQRGPLPVRAQEKKRPGPSPYHGPPSGRTTLPYPKERENHPSHRPRAALPDRRPMTTGRIPQPDDPLRQPVPPHPWVVPQAVAPVPALWSDRLPPRMRERSQQPSCGRAHRKWGHARHGRRLSAVRRSEADPLPVRMLPPPQRTGQQKASLPVVRPPVRQTRTRKPAR